MRAPCFLAMFLGLLPVACSKIDATLLQLEPPEGSPTEAAPAPVASPDTASGAGAGSPDGMAGVEVDPIGTPGDGPGEPPRPPSEDPPEPGGAASPVEVCSDAGVAPPDAGVTPPEPLPPLVAGLSTWPRAAAFLGMPSEARLTLRGWDFTDVYPALSFSDATFVMQEPVTRRLFVAQRNGRIFTFEGRADVSEKTLVLDISETTLSNGDRGLVGFALHPEFADPSSPNRGYIYVHYPHVAPDVPQSPPNSVITHSRLSRFSVDLATFQADPSSELVLIDQFDESPLHLGGALFFHPLNGYLYLTVGDEGMGCARSGNCQRIDKDLFSGVLRIDVDPNEDDDSHAIPRQPEAGTTAHYTIPNDNPFVGRENALEEFYAVGLRSPHRMTYDSVDDMIWLGDVGQTSREEIDVVTKGANFQWGDSEGFLRHRAPTANFVGTWTDPVLDLTRSDARSIVGGYVYRGQRFPELSGKYIFADFIYNSIWAVDYAWDGQRAARLGQRRLATAVAGRRESLTSLGVDLDGELYMTSLGTNRLKTLTFRDTASTNLPARLSETGIFLDVGGLSPGGALLDYEVQSALWSDGARKRRWLALPDGANITFAEHGPWVFPAGTVFVKHFDMALDERQPEQTRRLETRVLVAATGGRYYGATYKWNASGTDAELLLDSQTEPLEIIQADGTTRQQEYFYPSPADCLTCHNPSAGYVLGVRTAQLNGDTHYPSSGRTANQLWTWSELGLFDRRLTEAEVRALPSLAPLDDETRSVEDRVRSYWDSNCSMCHGSVAGIRANWDGRYQTPLAEQRVVRGPSVETEGAFVVVPGDVEASLMAVRDSTIDPDQRMPPLGRTRADREYVELLGRWIDSLAPGAVH